MWIKICGIHDVETALDVARERPSAIGLNFYRETPRRVSLDDACKIVQALPVEIEKVGLFVNHAAADIESICARCPLQTVQLHGDEPPEFLAELSALCPGLKIIRAYRLGADGLEALGEYLQSCNRLDVKISAVLIDSRVEGRYGGSGKTVSWKLLRDQYRWPQWPPVVLAGGLTADNVAEAIGAVRPRGVDVSSGVESAPGTKDLQLVRKFVDEARRAFLAIET